MPAVRHLRNAPITEAIIDFRVRAHQGIRAEEFAVLKRELAGRYPRVEERREVHATFGITKGEAQAPVVRDIGLQGFFFRTDDEKTIAQFRIDGFTVNRLSPYTAWEQIFPEATNLWAIYVRIAKPEEITRVAVRYINRIALPADPVDLDAVLRSAPSVPPELPQRISSFLTRVTIQQGETGIAAHVVQALDEGGGTNHLAIILDIDAYKDANLAVDDPEIRTAFQQLRAFKNLIFFNTLSEEVIRGYE